MGASLAGDTRYGGKSCAQVLGAESRSGRRVPNGARIPPPEKGRPSDYTGWIFLDRLVAMIQRVPQENRHGKVVLDP